MNHISFSPAMVESSCYFRSSPVLGGVGVLDLGYSPRHVEVSHCSEFAFPWWRETWSIFFMCLLTMCIFCDEAFSLIFQLTPHRPAPALTTRCLYPVEGGVGPVPAPPTSGCAPRVLLFHWSTASLPIQSGCLLSPGFSSSPPWLGESLRSLSMATMFQHTYS